MENNNVANTSSKNIKLSDLKNIMQDKVRPDIYVKGNELQDYLDVFYVIIKGKVII